MLNRGDPSPIYTRRPGTYKRASGSSSSGGDSGDSGAAGTIIISITASRRWRGQRGLVLGCSRPRRLHPERYRLATARGGALPWLWGSDGGLFPHFLFMGNEFVGVVLWSRMPSAPSLRASAGSAGPKDDTWPNEAMQQPRHRTKREGTQPGNVC